ncbi:phosphatidate cytidylyltransferase [Paenibacillus shirakamiensis]|uniref:Phosphatidate cytidylyltransferase n=1 Tax=Paenibacillus shirakamiensis TaxID=1265935 RepID=A0ABS4JHA5_9BACL|nr:phosphatidate cytidylyltransferase [Paenibacillus shirakamiensis]MBP2001083.1 phosphatidate cytidylyltransferase [Paenibacillus shirakamiensis]
MKQRLITGVAAAIVFLGLSLAGGFWYHSLILIMSLIGYFEFVRMTKTSAVSGTALLGFAGVFILVAPWRLMGISFTPQSLLWVLMLLFLFVTVFTKNRITIDQAALLFLGSVYVGIGFSYIAESRSTPDGHGLFWTFLLLFSIWASDAGAYFVGRQWGSHKLWPSISPNKTIEGALGGVVLAVVVAVGFALFSNGTLSIGRAVVLGLVAAVIGQLGDLVQSAYKRVYGIKDSGTLLPGHGGILDRCDSWLTVFPFVHILMLLPFYSL